MIFLSIFVVVGIYFFFRFPFFHSFFREIQRTHTSHTTNEYWHEPNCAWVKWFLDWIGWMQRNSRTKQKKSTRSATPKCTASAVYTLEMRKMSNVRLNIEKKTGIFRMNRTTYHKRRNGKERENLIFFWDFFLFFSHAKVGRKPVWLLLMDRHYQFIACILFIHCGRHTREVFKSPSTEMLLC